MCFKYAIDHLDHLRGHLSWLCLSNTCAGSRQRYKSRSFGFRRSIRASRRKRPSKTVRLPDSSVDQCDFSTAPCLVVQADRSIVDRYSHRPFLFELSVSGPSGLLIPIQDGQCDIQKGRSSVHLSRPPVCPTFLRPKPR